MMSMGKNTVAGELVVAYVERLEAIEAKKQDLAEDRAVIVAEARAAGLEPKGLAYLVKVRRMKPHDRQEMEALRDIYLHAAGLDQEPPLFRYASLMDVDVASRDSVVEALKKFCPAEGEIIVRPKGGKKPVRLWRDKAGEVLAEPYVEAPAKRAAPADPAASRRAEKPPPPDVDEAGAFELGQQAARDNRPVIDNPFPFGDPRRAKFDAGWRAAAGGDGMGPG